MRVESAALLLVAVLLVSSVSFAIPVGSSTGFTPGDIERDRPSATFGYTAPAPAGDPAPAPDSPEPLAGFASIHDRGVTGDDVRVGVVGTTFATDREGLSSSVAGSRRFADDGPGLLADTGHDTAVAELVSRTAPDADLYLASIGRDGGPETYTRAVSWLRERDVDVVVDAGSYFPTTAEGTARLNAAATAAVENDTAFVTSAGNYADRHWTGEGSEGWVAFANDTRYNTLGAGSISGKVSLRLYWQGSSSYDLYLYRAADGEDPLVAKSAAEETDDGRHTEAIDARLPAGRYYVAVRGGADANGSIDLFAATHDLSISSDTGGVVSPATAEGVLAVGAVDGVTGEPRPYSSAGPELDISAPDGAATTATGEFYGSSAAAPLVAGTLALMLGQNESLSPVVAQHSLRRTAAGDDDRLYLDAASAVESVGTPAPMDDARYPETTAGSGARSPRTAPRSR